jgi:CheY-like chemotaxis protein
MKNVLIVDDNQEMLLTIKEGLDRYQNFFSVMIAGDGRIAMEKLRQHWISLIITDLKMPDISGLELLTHIKQNYPEIPVVVITGYSTAALEEKLIKGGATKLIEKPFQIKSMAEMIQQILHRQYDGGVLHNVSPGMFIQLIEMEQKTCTVRVTCQKSGKEGVLFFREGELMDARNAVERGKKAAYDIFALDKVDLVIENKCKLSHRKIDADLQSVLLEALRIKDEKNSDLAVKEDTQKETKIISNANGKTVKEVWKKLKGLGPNSYLDDVFQDDSWDPFIAHLKKLGESASAGELKLAYVHQNQSKACFLIPESPPIIITADTKCPKDQIMRNLSISLHL